MIDKRGKKKPESRSGPDVPLSEPFFDCCFYIRDSLPDPCPVLCSYAVVASKGTNETVEKLLV
jgi:hypothetical protein